MRGLENGFALPDPDIAGIDGDFFLVTDFQPVGLDLDGFLRFGGKALERLAKSLGACIIDKQGACQQYAGKQNGQGECRPAQIRDFLEIHCITPDGAGLAFDGLAVCRLGGINRV